MLVDVGLFQGEKALRRRNREPFPVPPDSIDAVVLTHAHVDHVGYLPALVRDGFRGPVLATRGTTSLAGIVLPDSGRLQEEEADHANREGYSKHDPALPLYTEADARRSLQAFREVAYGETVAVGDDVEVELRPAGHILGSATVILRLRGPHGGRTVCFSGDLGRPNHPILRPPAPIGDADVVVVESTYGDRLHDDGDSLSRLADVVRRTIARGGTVVVPAFAVDRTEVVLHHLRELAAAGELPEVPVFVDSPMALAALAVYRAAIARGDHEISPRLDARTDPFDSGQVVEVHDVDESRALARLGMPAIIVSASGMATGGRVLHHLARLLPDERNTVLLVGFQAAGTRGRLLVDGAAHVRMFGRDVPVRAEVAEVSMSIHADRDELCEWLASADRRPDVVYLVHGEAAPSEALAAAVASRLGWDAAVPRLGERVRLD